MEEMMQQAQDVAASGALGYGEACYDYSRLLALVQEVMEQGMADKVIDLLKTYLEHAEKPEY